MAVLCVLVSDAQYTALVRMQMDLLPNYWEKLLSCNHIQLTKTALKNLFLLETQLSLNQAWIDTISQAMIEHFDWKYIHKELVPQLLVKKTNSKIHAILLNYCQQYLQQRVEQPPQPPENWSRTLPNSNKNMQIWQMLTEFMQSSTQQCFDYRKNQSERTLVENAIRAESVDLRMETIRQGSPHTLRLIKTQASYERQLRTWEQDVLLLRKIKQTSVI